MSVFGLLASAANHRHDAGLRFLLDGDLHQMSCQEEFFRARGLKMGRCDVYPGFYTEEDYRRGLQLLWDHSVVGWWNYREAMIERGICTYAQWCDKLGMAPENRDKSRL